MLSSVTTPVLLLGGPDKSQLALLTVVSPPSPTLLDFRIA